MHALRSRGYPPLPPPPEPVPPPELPPALDPPPELVGAGAPLGDLSSCGEVSIPDGAGLPVFVVGPGLIRFSLTFARPVVLGLVVGAGAGHGDILRLVIGDPILVVGTGDPLGVVGPGLIRFSVRAGAGLVVPVAGARLDVPSLDSLSRTGLWGLELGAGAGHGESTCHTIPRIATSLVGAVVSWSYPARTALAARTVASARNRCGTR